MPWQPLQTSLVNDHDGGGGGAGGGGWGEDDAGDREGQKQQTWLGTRHRFVFSEETAECLLNTLTCNLFSDSFEHSPASTLNVN